MKYKCILFDCDGVLVDTETITNRILIEMASEVGVSIKLHYAEKHYTGKPLKEVLQDISNKIIGELPPDFEQEFRKRTFALFKTDLQAINGIHSLLDQISVPIAVVSNGPMDKMKISLSTTNLIERFDGHVFSAYDIGIWKPDPGIYQFAAETMGFNSSECAVIEDSLSGIRAAKDGGFDVFGYVSLLDSVMIRQLGALPFETMDELMDLLRKTP